MARNLITREEVDAFFKAEIDEIDTDIEEIDNILIDLKARVDRLEQEEQLLDQVEDEIAKIRRDQDELRFQLFLAVGVQFFVIVIILWLQTT